MTLAPLLSASPAIQIHAFAAIAAFVLGVVQLSAPKGTPREIINVINREVNLALKDPEILAKLKNLGGIPIAGTPEDFGKIVASETDKWEKVVRAADLSVE